MLNPAKILTMIAIQRTSVPEIFNSHKMQDAIGALYLSNSKDNSLRARFDSDVLQLLHKELQKTFGNRCAFCETSVEVEYPEIVHFRPATGCRGLKGEYHPEHYWWLAYEWRNLYLSCSMCSKFRRDLFPVQNEKYRGRLLDDWDTLQNEKYLLLDPCVDNPEDFIAYDDYGLALATDERSKVTIEAFSLNRGVLVDMRRSEIDHFERILTGILQNFDKELIQELKGYINDLFSTTTRHSFPGVQRHFFKVWLGKNNLSWDEIMGLSHQISSKKLPAKTETEKTANFELSQNLSMDMMETVSLKDNLEIEILSNLQRFTIKSIHIKNLRSIASLDIKLLPSDINQNRESWLLMLGDNGIGKSSILQAIAIALGGEKEIGRLGVQPSEFLRRGKRRGSVIIRSHEQEEPIVLQFTSRKFTWRNIECPTFLLAYGATRLLPKGKLKAMPASKKKVNIDNLFDYSIALKDVNKWLKKVKKSDFDTRIAPTLADLLDLGVDDKICFTDDELSIRDGLQNYKMHQISDGYRSMIALGCDIMQTLSTYNGSFHSIQGTVLIDELGNHLHPRWRMKIASSLRRAFPSLQFIVSTHEPLCLRGLSYGEVIVLHEIADKDKDPEIEALDSKSLPDHTLLRVDQLLTSDFFGLINTLGEDKEKQYEEYYSLLAAGPENLDEANMEKLAMYKSTLADREIKGASPQIQALYEIVNENYVKKLKQEGFKTQRELKSETISEVSDMIKSKKIDWL